MRKRILTFFIALGVILTVGAGLLALQPAVFGIFEEEAGSPRMEKTAVYSGEALLRDRPYAKQVFFGDPYLAAVLQEQRNALAEAKEQKKEEELLELPEEDRTITYTFATGAAARQSGILSRFDAGVLELMQGADVFTVNNEFCYSLGGSPLPDKTYTLRARPDTAEWLHEMGTDLVTLANNHVFDYGETGLLDTLSTLQDADIPYIGAGKNMEEASSAVYFDLGPDGAVLAGKSPDGLPRDEENTKMRILSLSASTGAWRAKCRRNTGRIFWRTELQVPGRT